MSGYQMNFNQDFTSIAVLNKSGFRLFSVNSSDKVDEIFTKDNENIRIVERLFNSSLVVLVTVQKPNCLKMLHFKKKQDICNCVYPSDILCVRMNRHRLIVCLAESIHIHDIRDMKILHSIENIAPNELGLCSLSLNSHLAYPISINSGELRIFNANKLKSGISIRAHDTALSALSFSPNGQLLATASERGTVIRVFCVKNGQRVQEFRRGVKRCVRIASLVFSVTADFLCASSNTETVHIFKIDTKAVEIAERKPNVGQDGSGEQQEEQQQNVDPALAKKQSEVKSAVEVPAVDTNSNAGGGGSWSGYLSKAVTSYLIPSQVSDVLAQDRAFATAVLAQPGMKHICGIARVQKELKLLVACEDGFLYMYDFNTERGGQCKLMRAHDLRYALEGVIELNLTESIERISLPATPPATPPATSNKSVISSKSLGSTQIEAALKNGSNGSNSVIIENPDPAPDNSYAGILKGSKAANDLTESAKYRKLCDAIDTPTKLYDERQFPPVAIAARD